MGAFASSGWDPSAAAGPGAPRRSPGAWRQTEDSWDDQMVSSAPITTIMVSLPHSSTTASWNRRALDDPALCDGHIGARRGAVTAA
ncbi:hypothetical protein [Actinomadura sp. CNU-125]|uniref:hypothetical protein n=1 Tax=Actinomadura sp. CNU-125 TaxID=1904961 RepID=UPI0021CCAEF6|nr:hypothetical protein [Actinomadura sp. CNU-125]